MYMFAFLNITLYYLVHFHAVCLKQCKIMHQQLVEGFLRENREVHKYTYQLFLSHMCEIFMLS